MLYIINLESYKERYTYWWKDYIPREFSKYTDVQVIEGEPLTSTVDTGTVLDAGGTNYYKASQLKIICDMFSHGEIKNRDKFFICDIWFPGIEMIRYMSDLYKIEVQIYGIWHAGSITIGNFASVMHDWSKYFEIGFLNLCDKVFVGSDYSRQSIIDRLLLMNLPEYKVKEISEKIHAYGMPLDYGYLQQFSSEKENIILYPHRPDTEKGIDQYLNMIDYLSMKWSQFDKFKFIFCTSRKEYSPSSEMIKVRLIAFLGRYNNISIRSDLSKEEYYRLLGRSKFVISTTLEENFGYCIVEGIALRCIPIVPNAFSYPEILEHDTRFLYNSYVEACNIIINIDKTENIDLKIIQKYAQPYDRVVHQWLTMM